jgi:glycosyltransferase involved in cell wall biosynthesis
VKRVRFIIRAAEGLYRKYPQLKLVFFDSLVGKDRRDPRPMINTHVPHDFYLNLPQSKMAWLYSQGDIFVSAERRAGWSNTSAEAMACGIPVVCTRSGTQDFAFHNQTALVVSFPSSFLLRRQVKKLIKDEKLRSRLGRAGYEKIQEFSWSALVDRLEKIFHEKLK